MSHINWREAFFMIWENGLQGLSYVIEFEWHHPAIRLLHTQDFVFARNCLDDFF